MTTLLRPTVTTALLAIFCCGAASALAQNAAPAQGAQGAAPAAATTSYGLSAPSDTDRRAKQQRNEQALLGVPREYGLADPAQQANADSQQAALLDEQRMRVTNGDGVVPGGGAAPGRPRKAPAGANAQARAGVTTNAAASLTPEGASKNAYADPYATGAGNHAVYRSPW